MSLCLSMVKIHIGNSNRKSKLTIRYVDHEDAFACWWTSVSGDIRYLRIWNVVSFCSMDVVCIPSSVLDGRACSSFKSDTNKIMYVTARVWSYHTSDKLHINDRINWLISLTGTMIFYLRSFEQVMRNPLMVVSQRTVISNTTSTAVGEYHNWSCIVNEGVKFWSIEHTKKRTLLLNYNFIAFKVYKLNLKRSFSLYPISSQRKK